MKPTLSLIVAICVLVGIVSSHPPLSKGYGEVCMGPLVCVVWMPQFEPLLMQEKNMAEVEARSSCSIDDLLKCQEEINRELIMFFMLSILVVKNFKECVILILRIWSQISVALFLDQLKRYFLFLLLLKFFSLKRQWATAAAATLWPRSPPASTTFSRVMLPGLNYLGSFWIALDHRAPNN